MKIDIKYEKGFIENIERHPALLYADTDSLYVAAQNKDLEIHGEDFKDKFIANKHDKDQWSCIIDQALILADEINNEIDFQMKEVIGQRANLDSEFQSLFFKTEMIALRMMQFNVKKTYALAYFYDEGKVLEKPAAKIVGGQIKKSSTPRISRRLFKEVYNTMLFSEIETVSELKDKIFVEIYNEYVKEFKKYFDEWNFAEIGLPYKYGFGKSMTKWIWGALFYNTFFKDEIRPGESMYALYIRYNQNKLKKLLSSMDVQFKQYQLKSDIVEPKWDMISVPVSIGSDFYELYKDEIKFLEKEIEFQLSWDHNKDTMIDKKFLQFKTFFE